MLFIYSTVDFLTWALSMKLYLALLSTTVSFSLFATTTSTPKTAGNIDFPVIPAIMIPSVPSADKVQSKLSKSLQSLLKPMSGISIRPARCESQGDLIDEFSITSIDADGNFQRVSQAGIFEIEKDGSGNVVTNGVVYESDGNGAGSIVSGDDVFESDGDGAGSYTGKFGVIELDGNGSGSWTGENFGVIEINSDGSGSWTGGSQGVIEINSDGSGSWVSEDGVIENFGNGKGTINGQEIAMLPIPPVQPAGQFPPIQALNPPKKICGYVVTLSDRILFDFDKSELRKNVTPYLQAIADGIKHTKLTHIEVRGHTDARGSDSYNQSLSERRAATVKEALLTFGVNSKAIGFGESRPVAPNTSNGKDNPAGRQLNRRVELFLRK